MNEQERMEARREAFRKSARKRAEAERASRRMWLGLAERYRAIEEERALNAMEGLFQLLRFEGPIERRALICELANRKAYKCLLARGKQLASADPQLQTLQTQP